jgi:hypothetical protein
MISAVCGRAPPLEDAPNVPFSPPALPLVSHDWLSVIKTRGLFAGATGAGVGVGVGSSVWAKTAVVSIVANRNAKKYLYMVKAPARQRIN